MEKFNGDEMSVEPNAEPSPVQNQDETNIPELRYRDQTPISRPDSERPRATLSPMAEEENNDDFSTKVENAVKLSMATIVPGIIDQLKNQLADLIKDAIQVSMQNLKQEIMSEVYWRLSFQKMQCDLKALSEAELVESYTRRENVKILGVQESSNRETNEETMEKVLKVANETNAQIEFIRKMREDQRIVSTWTREGTIFFVWKDDGKIYRIQGLYEGAKFLDYSQNDLNECFGSVFGNSSNPSGS